MLFFGSIEHFLVKIERRKEQKSITCFQVLEKGFDFGNNAYISKILKSGPNTVGLQSSTGRT